MKRVFTTLVRTARHASANIFVTTENGCTPKYVLNPYMSIIILLSLHCPLKTNLEQSLLSVHYSCIFVAYINYVFQINSYNSYIKFTNFLLIIPSGIGLGIVPNNSEELRDIWGLYFEAVFGPQSILSIDNFVARQTVTDHGSLIPKFNSIPFVWPWTTHILVRIIDREVKY